MPNRNYEKGRRKEYKIANDMKKLGFTIAQRAAGSHSPVDIFCINPGAKQIRLIQAKPDNMNDKQKQKIRNENKELNGKFDVTFSVI